ncbi:MAG: hypothetical protein V1664_03955 [Candidatus Uhrbacteria bacterium]
MQERARRVDPLRAADYLGAWRGYRTVDNWEKLVKARRFALDDIKREESGGALAAA